MKFNASIMEITKQLSIEVRDLNFLLIPKENNSTNNIIDTLKKTINELLTSFSYA